MCRKNPTKKQIKMLKTEKRMRARDFEQNQMQDGKARKEKNK
jgi:hypothetical protein